jgi:hypothetical protein
LKVSIGRIVHVKKAGRCVAAIVTDVHADEMIDATTFPAKAAPAVMMNVKKGIDDQAPLTWHWPEKVE